MNNSTRCIAAWLVFFILLAISGIFLKKFVMTIDAVFSIPQATPQFVAVKIIIGMAYFIIMMFLARLLKNKTELGKTLYEWMFLFQKSNG